MTDKSGEVGRLVLCEDSSLIGRVLGDLGESILIGWERDGMPEFTAIIRKDQLLSI